MRPFIYHRATSDSAALQTVIGGAAPRDQPPTSARAQFIAGGTTMLDLMKLDVMRPSEVIDINRIAGLDQVEKTPDGLRLGALARMADVARHPLLADYPVIAQSLTLGEPAIAEHGDARRQRPATNALYLFSRSVLESVQQARPRLRLRGARWLQPVARRARRQRSLYRDLSRRFRPSADRPRRLGRNPPA